MGWQTVESRDAENATFMKRGMNLVQATPQCPRFAQISQSAWDLGAPMAHGMSPKVLRDPGSSIQCVEKATRGPGEAWATVYTLILNDPPLNLRLSDGMAIYKFFFNTEHNRLSLASRVQECSRE
jgi:hypothetical protein